MIKTEDLEEVISIVTCYVTNDLAGSKGAAWAHNALEPIRAELHRRKRDDEFWRFKMRRLYGERRRAKRRARKALKNRVMFKTFGRRPWNWWVDMGERTGDALGAPDISARRRMEHLREPSGFKDLSQRAAAVYTDETCNYTEDDIRRIMGHNKKDNTP